VKFTIDTVHYDFDLEELSFDEAELVEDFTGYTVLDFGQAVMSSRVKALRALVFLAKRRNGEEVEWADLGGIDLLELALSIVTENEIDLSKADNGANPAAVEELGKRIAARKAARGGNRAGRRATAGK
jgi:hypothetical protein